ncbi:ATP-grasp domain-containing protein [Salipiger marinus]|uniref:ATP-grasp domain-containing protein n=1 Tax=Salipiger marinus TaxID=555512 RepID=A0A1G8UJR6_9RHOB|nr:ATP-grasp domain-containing protein [Salipiger marinus]SDJ54063.1 ATP-grasp domain-containing protein [Salipiger marinus]
MRYFFNHCLTEHAHVFDMLRAADPSVHITAANSHKGSPVRLAADTFLDDPAAGEGHAMPAGYAEWLLEAAREARADIVIPYRHRMELADFRDCFEAAGIRLLTAADRQTMTVIEQKPAFLQWAEETGIPISPFREFSCLETFEAAVAAFDPMAPLCIKPSSGVGAVGFRRLVDDEAPGAAAVLLGLDAMVLGKGALRRLLSLGPLSRPMMLMLYLRGPERSTDFVCLDGEILGAVTRMRSGLYQKVGDDMVSFAMATTLARELGMSGLLNLQTRCLDDGSQVLLELNSRAAGGIGQTAPSGVNLPGLLHEALCGRRPEVPRRAGRTVRVARREMFLEI